MPVATWISGIGLLVVFSTFLAAIIYRSGHLSARVEELEKWRSGMRADMHEISEKITNIATAVHGLHTLIAERTDPRPRWSPGDVDRRPPHAE